MYMKLQQVIISGPPEFSRVPENSSVVSGDSVQLPCSGDGVPPVTLTWWSEREGVVTQVRTDGQYFVSRDFLLLTATSQFHEGLYYCNLSSEAGTVLSDLVFLDVLSKAVASTPLLFHCPPSPSLPPSLSQFHLSSFHFVLRT